MSGLDTPRSGLDTPRSFLAGHSTTVLAGHSTTDNAEELLP